MSPHNKSPADRSIGRDHVDKGSNDDNARSASHKDDATRGKSSDGDNDEELDKARGGSRNKGQVNDDDDWSSQR